LKKSLNLKNPATLDEKLQWKKLYDRQPRYTKMVDKYEVRSIIKERIGEEYLVPLLGVWDRYEDIDFDKLPDQFVLKCTHDSGGLAIVRDKAKFDKEKVRKQFKLALSRNPYSVTREWPYKNVKPRIIAEQYIEDKKTLSGETLTADESEAISCDTLQKKHGLLDYKFLCFDGKVRLLFLDIGVIGGGQEHAEEYYRNVYDQNGQMMSFKETREHYPARVALPDNLQDMILMAVNDALRQMNEDKEKTMGALTSGIKIPGVF